MKKLREVSGWRLGLLGLAVAAGLVPPMGGATPGASDLAFFEAQVRPLLERRCYSCHSTAQGKVKAGLELDWKGGWEKGGDSGPALIPGAPDKSLLIKAVRYADPDLQMPPKGERLSSAEVATLVSWVQRGAPDSRTERSSGHDPKAHWAFKPVREPAIPSVKEPGWIATPVDAFILSKLEEVGLSHAPEADRSTLIRRLYFDLIGLPPSPEEVDAFVQDTSPKAWEDLVDRLLASPHYGERWGRHWLDLARYSDTKGQFRRQRESSLYPYAWTYRDYVIKAFNDDKPYDRFILEQLAGDKFPVNKGNHALAAMGFLTVGEHYNGNENDIINDRIDVVTKGFLGLTVSCARCHDHRFDPIPQADYYSLHGIFASSVQPVSSPLLSGSPTNTPAYADYLKDRSELELRMENVSTGLVSAAFGDYRHHAGVYLFATTLPVKEQAPYLTKNGADPELLKNWQQLIRVGTRREGGVFRLWQFLQRVPAARLPEQSRRLLSNLGQDERTRGLPTAVVEVFRGQSPKSIAEVASLYGFVFAKADAVWQSRLNGLLTDVALLVVPNRQRARYVGLREQYDRLELTHAGAPARAMPLLEGQNPKDSPIFLRGEVGNKGEVVPRRFLEILSGPTRPPFKEGSGRLPLAQAIASPNNPLTARVMVNRVWLHHFGEGFVTTPDDFGNQSNPPSHPELLDWLASRFMKQGWSIKQLHRQIVLSSAYRQSSDVSAQQAMKDPANRWLSHANVRRLEYEPLRDAILQVSGKLDLSVGGKPVDLSEGTHQSGRRGAAAAQRLGLGIQLSTAPRRSVYGFIDRVDLLEVLNTFDFANPSICSGKRYETTVPQQALFLMNSPLVVEHARDIIQRPDFVSLADDEARIRFLYRLLFQRLPSAEEVATGKAFLDHWVPGTEGAATPVAGQFKKRLRERLSEAKPQPKALPKWAEYTHALLMTTDMSFVR